MSRQPIAMSMEEAARFMNLSRRALQDIIKRHPHYFQNGRRKLFTEADVAAIRLATGMVDETSISTVLKSIIGAPVAGGLEKLNRIVDENHTGHIYFVRCNGRVKIGYTTNWTGRLRILKTSCPHPVEVIALVPGSRELETHLHRRFKVDRRHGEWFEETADFKRLTSRLGVPS